MVGPWGPDAVTCCHTVTPMCHLTLGFTSPACSLLAHKMPKMDSIIQKQFPLFAVSDAHLYYVGLGQRGLTQ